jgi:hypothetical protein
MASATRPRIAVVLAALLAGVSAAGCSSSSSSSGGGSVKPPQALFSTRLRNDIRALDQGVLTYTRLGTLQVGENAEFSVWVTDIGKPQPKQVASARETSKQIGVTVYPWDVPTGGYVEVQMTTCSNLTCHRQSSPSPQLVEPYQRVAQWEWLISAKAPGPALISLTVDTYKESTAELLKEETVVVNVKVQASKNHTPTGRPSPTRQPVASGGGGSSNAVTIWAAVIVAIGGIIGGWLGNRKRRRRTRAASPKT